MKLDGTVAADIHIGAPPTEVLRNELRKVFLKHIKEKENLDFLIIPGDLLDRKLSFNGADSKLAIEFVDDALKIVRRKKNKSGKKTKVRLIKGTESHDLNQLNNFLHYEKNPNYDFRIIQTVTEEELFPGVHVLYIPEEYMEDKDEYYAEFLNGSKIYDFVFGHGTFAHVGYVNESQESERPMKHAPIWDYREFKDIVKGGVFFGHIHTASVYKDLIHYTGSFSRWSFGEEDDKGFWDISYDTKKTKMEATFIKNHLARVYRTLDINKLFADTTRTIEQKIAIIEKNKNKKGIDFLRVKVDKVTLENEAEGAILKAYFANNSASAVKVQMNNLRRATEEVEESKVEEEYQFVFERTRKNIPMKTVVHEYLLKKENININEEIIADILQVGHKKGD